ncbi:MAG: immunity 70 family protein [Oscillospiraceae bacterium]|nr:immunity 70 family protein [Oscillospiraceae bacterium]
MSVVLTVKVFGFPIGTGDFFFSFFSTVAVRLEKEQWGSRFPVIMKELYRGSVPAEHLRQAEKELSQIRSELKRFPRSEVVWDYEDRSKQPPWGDNVSETIRDLSDYFVTSDGKNLLAVMRRAIGAGRALKAPVVVESL